MGNCYLEKINYPITYYLQKKCRYEYMYGRELSLISFKIY